MFTEELGKWGIGFPSVGSNVNMHFSKLVDDFIVKFTSIDFHLQNSHENKF